METDILPDWKLKFFYSVGSIQDIKNGSLEKTFLEENSNLKSTKLLAKSGSIYIPKVIGIYESSYVFNETPEMENEREATQEKMNEAEALMFKHKFGKGDECVHDLISIVYNPHDWLSSGIVRQELRDISGRIAITSTDNVPDFYEKNIIEMFFVTNDYAEAMGDREIEDINPEELDKLIRTYSQRMKRLMAKWKIYGLTRGEYTTITDFDSYPRKSPLEI